MKKTAYTLSILACAVLCACSSPQYSAPISDISDQTSTRPHQTIDADTVTYTVESGDTLSQIARRSNHSVAELVAWNNISSPDTIEVGQELRLKPPEGGAMATPVDTGSSSSTSSTTTSSVSQAQTQKPVVAEPKPAIDKNTVFYVVEPGDTLSQIARRSSHSVSELVAWNELASPDAINVGQKLRVQKPTETAAVAKKEPVKKTTVEKTTATKTSDSSQKTVASTGAVSTVRGVSWSWPTHGKVISTYTAGRRGIDISGTRGQKVVAAADGVVLHRGAMNGYGNLLIIKHNDNVLSAYAHNDRLLVKENQHVKRGQQIAEMGSTDSERVKLHFEIRYQGKPVDPTKYLPNQ